MFEDSKVIKSLSSLIAGLKKKGHIDLIECENIEATFFEYKFSIETSALDLLIKWLEVNVFLQVLSSGAKITTYSCGPLTNKSGWSVLHLRVDVAA